MRMRWSGISWRCGTPGLSDDIRLEVVDGEKGKIITFYVREKKLVRSIAYKGLSSVQQSDVLDEFKKRRVGLSIQSQFDPVIVKRAQVVLENMLSAHGRQFAKVRARTRRIPPNFRCPHVHRFRRSQGKDRRHPV